MRHRRPFLRAAVACTALGLVLAACGSEESDPGSSPEEPSEPAAPETWPLTGLEADGSVAKSRPPLVVKMDNTESSAPQVGLSSADLVVEELVEGGITRLAAFYYSDIPDTVGPVRSMRASDIGIVSPVGGDIVTSGGAAPTVQRVNQAGITFYGEGGPGMHRDSGRSAPYNLMNGLPDAAKAAKGDGKETPADYLPWGDPADLPKGKKASAISANFGSRVTQWEFRDGGYVNTNTYAAQGDQFPADTVLAIRVGIVDAGYQDPAGNFVPETEFVGKGKAVLFHDGRAIPATWSKDAEDSPVTLSNKKGDIVVPPGRTWIELVPNDAHNGSLSYQK